MSSAHIVRGTAFGLFFDPSRYEELRAAIAEDVSASFHDVQHALAFLGFILNGRTMPVKLIDHIHTPLAEFENSLKLIAPYVRGKASLSLVLSGGELKEYRVFGGKVYLMKPVDMWEIDSCI